VSPALFCIISIGRCRVAEDSSSKRQIWNRAERCRLVIQGRSVRVDITDRLTCLDVTSSSCSRSMFRDVQSHRSCFKCNAMDRLDKNWKAMGIQLRSYLAHNLQVQVQVQGSADVYGGSQDTVQCTH